MKKPFILVLSFIGFSAVGLAQSTEKMSTENWTSSPGIIGTLIFIIIIAVIALLIISARVKSLLKSIKAKKYNNQDLGLGEELKGLSADERKKLLEKREKALAFKLSGDELGGKVKPNDDKGLVNKFAEDPDNPVVDEKKKSPISFETPDKLKKVILYYIGAATFWLLFGTLIGQYLGMKFVWPDMDHISWLSFGRLRPVHTNTVFWGWASMAMIGLAYFVIARTSNTRIYSYKIAWRAFYLINASVILGNICLMSGINNGGGEYREYIWPVMLLFAVALIITCWNFVKTVATRKISEIYISNWYIIASLLFTIVLATIGYLPFSGLGETVTQGYYMHQGVGMWFMTFTLGLTYYYLPSSLNKPIYSYSLGVLAFWTQLLFYTMIGTHHFVFSPLPWWLQTIAIVFSVGMFIPVFAGTTNFIMTMRGSWSHISKSYVLPFFLVGVVYYCLGSSQGSMQAFRFTNYVWHFTDFNVAHSHMTMYGIICFMLWAAIYAIVPKLTGREPKQIFVGAHFWMAFIGLFAYIMSMMIGGTLKGISWMEGHPFIESVLLMKHFWVWRAVGGSLMLTSHFVFAYNFYVMTRKKESTLEILG